MSEDRTEAREPVSGCVEGVSARLSADFLSTGDLARACETTVRTVRFYEETGLIEPLSRSDGGHRHFDQAQREKLQLIMDLREAGLSIQDIKDLFALKSRCATPDEASALMAKTLECRIGEMQRKIAVLRRLREELASMVTVIRECETCETKAAFPMQCGDCDVMARPDLPRAMRLLWSK